MPQTPLGGKAQWLLSIQDIPDDVGGQEGQTHELLDATLRGVVSRGDVGECFTRFDPFEPRMGKHLCGW